MADKKLHLRILTSENVKIDEQVDMVIMRCITEVIGTKSAVGDIGIMPGHVDCSMVLGINAFRIINDGKERQLAVYGGVATVENNVVTVLTEKAEWPEEIDQKLAEANLEKAKGDMENITSDDISFRRNEILLRRSNVQIEVSSYNLLGDKNWNEEQ